MSYFHDTGTKEQDSGAAHADSEEFGKKIFSDDLACTSVLYHLTMRVYLSASCRSEKSTN